MNGVASTTSSISDASTKDLVSEIWNRAEEPITNYGKYNLEILSRLNPATYYRIDKSLNGIKKILDFDWGNVGSMVREDLKKRSYNGNQ